MAQKKRQKWVFSHISAYIYNKKQSLIKKGLCGDLHLDALFQTKKKINMLIGPGPRNPCTKIKKIIKIIN
jgi:hypothetical protein